VGCWVFRLVAAGNIFESGGGDDGEGKEAGGVSGGDGERPYLLLGICGGSLKSFNMGEQGRKINLIETRRTQPEPLP
jgi:hypothetical protein